MWLDRIFGPTADAVGSWLAASPTSEDAAGPFFEHIEESLLIPFATFDFNKHWKEFCASGQAGTESTSKSAAWEELSKIPSSSIQPLLTSRKFEFDPEVTDYDKLGQMKLLEVSRSTERYFFRKIVGFGIFAAVIIGISVITGDGTDRLGSLILILAVIGLVVDWLERKFKKRRPVEGQIEWTVYGLGFAKTDLFPELNSFIQKQNL